MKAVAVISGGLDSVTSGYLLRSEGFDLRVISFDYGQRHRKELEFARRAASRLRAIWTLIDLKAAGLQRLLTGSALTDEVVEVPYGQLCLQSVDLRRMVLSAVTE